MRIEGNQDIVFLQVRQQIYHEITGIVILVPVIPLACMVVCKACKKDKFQVFIPCGTKEALNGLHYHIFIERRNKYGDLFSIHKEPLSAAF